MKLLQKQGWKYILITSQSLINDPIFEILTDQLNLKMKFIYSESV